MTMTFLLQNRLWTVCFPSTALKGCTRGRRFDSESKKLTIQFQDRDNFIFEWVQKKGEEWVQGDQVRTATQKKSQVETDLKTATAAEAARTAECEKRYPPNPNANAKSVAIEEARRSAESRSMGCG